MPRITFFNAKNDIIKCETTLDSIPDTIDLARILADEFENDDIAGSSQIKVILILDE